MIPIDWNGRLRAWALATTLGVLGLEPAVCLTESHAWPGAGRDHEILGATFHPLSPCAFRYLGMHPRDVSLWAASIWGKPEGFLLTQIPHASNPFSSMELWAPLIRSTLLRRYGMKGFLALHLSHVLHPPSSERRFWKGALIYQGRWSPLFYWPSRCHWAQEEDHGDAWGS